MHDPWKPAGGSSFDFQNWQERMEAWGRPVPTSPAATKLRKTQNFGANPGALRMFSYLPPGLELGSALAVVLHGCTQTAAAYDFGAGWSTLADRYRFALIFPEQQKFNNPNGCFNWFLPGDTMRGQGEALSTSNAGHALFAGIAAPGRAARVAAALLTPDAFSGWGLRTLSAGQPRYNPMSYHNGSVWPHDNALIAIGFAHYGLKVEASRLLSAIFDAGRHQDLARLPELFCGFNRRPNRAPTPYPVACAPQAWSAAAIFGLLGACLGMELVHERNEIQFRDPVLPHFVDEVIIRNLRLGASRADVRLHRYGSDVTANVLARSGSARILISK